MIKKQFILTDPNKSLGNKAKNKANESIHDDERYFPNNGNIL